MRDNNRHLGFGWSGLIIGILLILLGIVSVIVPSILLTWAVVIYGVFAIVTGIEDIVVYVRITRHTGFGPTISLITGILSIMVGTMLLARPSAGATIVVLLFPIWFIAHSIARLSQLNILRMNGNNFLYYFTLIANIIGIILGILMIFSPSLSYDMMGITAGITLIILGVDFIIQAVTGSDRDR